MIDEYLFLSGANIRQKLRFNRLIYKQKKHPKKGAFIIIYLENNYRSNKIEV